MGSLRFSLTADSVPHLERISVLRRKLRLRGPGAPSSLAEETWAVPPPLSALSPLKAPKITFPLQRQRHPRAMATDVVDVASAMVKVAIHHVLQLSSRASIRALFYVDAPFNSLILKYSSNGIKHRHDIHCIPKTVLRIGLCSESTEFSPPISTNMHAITSLLQGISTIRAIIIFQLHNVTINPYPTGSTQINAHSFNNKTSQKVPQPERPMRDLRIQDDSAYHLSR